MDKAEIPSLRYCVFSPLSTYEFFLLFLIFGWLVFHKLVSMNQKTNMEKLDQKIINPQEEMRSRELFHLQT